MKKLLTIILAVVTLTTFAQKKDSTAKVAIYKYLSVGVSTTNSNDFKASSYPSLEGGIVRDNLGLGVVFGRGSLKGLGKPTDSFDNYYYEVKASGYYPLGSLSGVFILGYGGYFNTSHNFIEYGVGMSYSINKFSYGATYSNWDGQNYVTPSITFNF